MRIKFLRIPSWADIWRHGLIEHQHHDIAIITGNLKKPLARNRLKGYKQALQEYNIPIRDKWIIESHFNFEGGIKGMEQLLQLKQRPSAVFACSDTIQVGAYQAVWRHGLSVPEDISLLHDNIHLAQYLSPPLSTVHQPKDEFAHLAVDTLLQRIKNPTESYRTLTLKPEIVLRQRFVLVFCLSPHRKKDRKCGLLFISKISTSLCVLFPT